MMRYDILTLIAAIAASNWACACYFKLREISKKLDKEARDNENKQNRCY